MLMPEGKPILTFTCCAFAVPAPITKNNAMADSLIFIATCFRAFMTVKEVLSLLRLQFFS
jgi:hypothetical protein